MRCGERRWTRSILWALTGLLVASCQSSSTTSTSETTDPGPLNLTLAQTVPGGEILLVQIEGGPITSVLPAFGIQSSSMAVDATHHAVLFRGVLPSGTIATVMVPDRRTTYRVSFLDAAAGRSGAYARQTADQYHVTIAR